MPQPTLKILAFGASLVEGFTANGTKFTPYARWMQERLVEELGTGSGKGTGALVEVDVDGRSGDMVTLGTYGDRMRSRFPTPAAQPYDWVLLLGGTNDLGYRRPADQIFAALQSVSRIALDHKAKVLLMTIPECASFGGGVDKRLEGERERVNKLIRGWVSENVYIFDLHKEMPFHNLSEEQRRNIWDDGVHFTEKGYQIMGEKVADRLIEIIGGLDKV